MVTTRVGESVVAKKLYRKCPIMLPIRITYLELVQLDMVDFDIILGMDMLHVSFGFYS